MCGIAGFWLGSDRSVLGHIPAQEVLRRMATSIAHRGPDGEGVQFDENSGVGFAHRRLAIVDLAATGAQPMVSASGRLVITYNGEIYNAPELRTTLEARGVVFRGTCDTEVLLEACATWGVEATLQRLNGMFAFALWDRAERQLHLVRDHAGIKPLYWGEVRGATVFGSELKVFHQVPGFVPEVDVGSLASYFQFLYVPAPECIYRGLRSLLPGEWVIVREGGRSESRRWWDAVTVWGHAVREPVLDANEAREGLQEVLTAAVRRQRVADVEVGTFLSGGIDSSTVSAMLGAAGDAGLRSFCIGYADPRYDESPHAEAMARALGTRHETLRFDESDALGLVPSLADVYDEPFADFSQLPTLMVSRLARERVKAILSGDGGDEQFAGYGRHRSAPRAWARVPRTPFAALNRLLGRACTSSARVARGLGRPGLADGAIHVGRVLQAADFPAFYRSHLIQGRWPVPPLQRVHAADPGSGTWGGLHGEPLDPRTQARLLDLLFYLPGDILTKVDRASMWHGLEVRVPLLDRAVMEWVPRLPERMMVHEGRTKLPLRQLLGRHVDPELFDRPKVGFHVPLREWLEGGLRDWAEDLLSTASLGQSALLDAPRIRDAWSDFKAGTGGRPGSIWAVLMFQAWWRRFHG